MAIHPSHNATFRYLPSPLSIYNTSADQLTQPADAATPDHVIIDIPEDEYTPYHPDLQNNASKVTSEPVKDGAMFGFVAGIAISIIGIPVLLVVKAESDQKITQKKADDLTNFIIPLAFPGILLGIALMPIGAAIGGIIKLCKHLNQRLHHEKQD